MFAVTVGDKAEITGVGSKLQTDWSSFNYCSKKRISLYLVFISCSGVMFDNGA